MGGGHYLIIDKGDVLLIDLGLRSVIKMGEHQGIITVPKDLAKILAKKKVFVVFVVPKSYLEAPAPGSDAVAYVYDYVRKIEGASGAGKSAPSS